MTQSKSNDSEKGALVIKCPSCARPSHFHPKNPFRPFCSARCQTADTAAWAEEQYRVAGDPIDPQDLPTAGESGADDDSF